MKYDRKMNSGVIDSGSGGILRSSKQKRSSTNGGGRGVGVTFSSSEKGDIMPPSRSQPHNFSSAGDDEYDSDEVDAIMASGGALSMIERHHKTGDGDDGDGESDMDNDPAVHGSLEIEEAKRKRGRVRRNEDLDGRGFADVENNYHNGCEDPSLSLITDHGANPDIYESNAGGNASCPVEPFNMNAEQESGLGYFDGDTYVFRQNNKRVDGEEDAWLDGFKGDDHNREIEEDAKGGGGGGLDSTAIWKPSSDTTKITRQKDTFKFIDENATPEEIGRRLVTLLQSDDEAVMKALTRLGSQLREMQSKEQKLKKRNGRKRKPKTKQEAVENNDSSTSDAADEEVKHLNIQMEHTRKVVQELTELADALLFGGETDAYELTKADWIHRFQLEQYPSSLARQRPTDISDERPETKKQRRGYFDDATNNNNDENGESSNQSEPMLAPHDDYNEVMWEYKGNEDGAIHGPYTSRQMMEWTSCGYFVGESAVDIRRVGSLSSELGKSEKKAEATTTSKTDVDDLMADLDSDEEDDDEAEGNESGAEGHESVTVNAESSWMKSDRVDFSLYL